MCNSRRHRLLLDLNSTLPVLLNQILKQRLDLLPLRHLLHLRRHHLDLCLLRRVLRPCSYLIVEHCFRLDLALKHKLGVAEPYPSTLQLLLDLHLLLHLQPCLVILELVSS